MSNDNTAGAIALEIVYVAVTFVAISVAVYGAKRVGKKVMALRAAKS